ncbi:Wzz/FepE/Etk N-terminal domain-containing protein [Insolitispirillum peregrinum]|uniref:Chain length determinant protein n=1 Tax=Insolitispirillum peregrinum TaxID=80876 RepID=A0A1N7JB39_9PROT|nr:Wzz/FepE/Etk N-terminal domain-containing protein [Insolitispirillum peregrinum]SIS46500.1 Chain length determinant protein [Insolitispirillum peregrinum]
MADMTTRDDTPLNLSLLRLMTRGKKTIIVTMIVFMALSIVYMRGNPPVFTAQFTIDTLGPEDRFLQESKIGLTIKRPSYSLNDDMMVYYQTFTSQRVFDRAIDHYGLSRILYPALWDSHQERWIQSDGVLPSIRNFLNRLIGRNLPPNGPENHLFMADKIRKSLTLIRGYGRLLNITFAHEDAAVAVRVLEVLHQATIDEMRQSRLQNALNIVRMMKAGYEEQVNVITKREVLDEIIHHEQRAMILSYEETPIISMTIKPIIISVKSSLEPVSALPLSAIAGIISGGVLNILIFLWQIARQRQIRLYGTQGS